MTWSRASSAALWTVRQSTCSSLPDRFIIRPLHPWWSESHWSGGRPVPDGFRYSSDVNDRKLTTDELVDMINA